MLLKKAKSFLRAVWSLLRHGDAPLAEHDRRQKICLDCDRLDVTETGVFCLECRCPHWPGSDLRTKWRMRDLRCPLNKWKRRNMVRAKVICQYVQDFGNVKLVKLVPVTPNADDDIPENERFHKYTPNGSIELTIDNPAAADQFKPQQTYYLDFTPAPSKEAE